MEADIKQRLKDNRRLEEYYNELDSTQERSEFKGIINKLRKDNPQMNILQYWYYRLKVAEDGTSVRNISTNKQPQSKKREGNYLPALIGAGCGIVTGMVLWLIVKIVADTILLGMSAATLTILITLNLQLVLSYRYVKHIKLFVLVNVTFLLSLFLVNILSKGEDYRNYISVGLVIFSGFFIGLSSLAIAQSKLDGAKSVLSGFTYYFDEVSKVLMISVVVNMVVGVVVGLILGLLALIFKDLGTDLPQLLLIVGFTTTPYTVLGIIYDFKKPLESQDQLAIVTKLLQGLFLVVSFVVLFFLAIYIPALVPSSFSSILETGDTTAIFLGMTALTLAGVLIGGQLLRSYVQPDFYHGVQAAHIALLIEAFILVCVAGYAIGVRIDAYGITVERIIAVLAVLVGFMAVVLTGAVVIYSLVKNFDSKKYTLNLRYTFTLLLVISLILLFYIPTLVDFERLSYNYQYNRMTEGNENDLTKSLDRSYFKYNGKKPLNFLAGKYDTANTKTKIDILMTFYEVKQYQGTDDGRLEMHATKLLKKIAEDEPNADISNLALKLVQFSADDYSYTNTKSSANQACEETVDELINPNSETDIEENIISNFCAGNYVFSR